MSLYTSVGTISWPTPATDCECASGTWFFSDSGGHSVIPCGPPIEYALVMEFTPGCSLGLGMGVAFVTDSDVQGISYITGLVDGHTYEIELTSGGGGLIAPEAVRYDSEGDVTGCAWDNFGSVVGAPASVPVGSPGEVLTIRIGDSVGEFSGTFSICDVTE